MKREPNRLEAVAPSNQGLAPEPWYARTWNRIGTYRWILVMVVSVLIASTAMYYQARKPGAEADYEAWATEQVDSGSEQALLSIAYPRELRLEATAEPRPISVWLQQPTSTSGPTPTPSPTFTPTVTPACEATCQEPPSTATPTPTPRPWIVAFSPHTDGFMFTDKDGVPVAPQVALTPGSKSAAPAVLYVQRAPLATAVVAAAPIEVSVYQPDGGAVGDAASRKLQVGLESSKSSILRHFLDLLFGPTTPLLAIAGALGALAMELRKQHTQERQTEWEQALLNEIEDLAGLDSQPGKAFDLYCILLDRLKAEPGKCPKGARHRLEELYKPIERKIDYADELKTSFVGFQDERVHRCAERIPANDRERIKSFLMAVDYQQKNKESTASLPVEEARGVMAALFDLLETRNKGISDRAVQQLKALLKQQGWDKETTEREMQTLALARGWPPSTLAEVPEEWRAPLSVASQWVEPVRWLKLWPESRPADDPAIARLLQSVGLTFNPFGPESAELDPLLERYRVNAPNECARGRKATLILGTLGSGKTAAALALALACMEPFSQSSEAGAMPVQYFPPLDLAPDSIGQLHMRLIARATAQTAVRYIAHRPGGFLGLAQSRKQSIIHLLSLWIQSPDHLAAELQRVGPGLDGSDDLLDEMKRLYQPISQDDMTARDYLDLLREARPAGFDSTYLLVDFSISAVAAETPAAQKALQSLVDLAVPLASSSTYLKLFLPKDLSSHLGDPPEHNIAHLTWDQEDLAKMLDARIRAAGGDSLMALCEPDVSRELSLDERLLRAAGNSPRQLVHLGNRLLEVHVRRSPEAPKLSAGEIDQVLGPPDGGA